MARFGINPENIHGVSIPTLRVTAKKIGCNHNLALKLWTSEIYGVRILASLVNNLKKVMEEQMELGERLLTLGISAINTLPTSSENSLYLPESHRIEFQRGRIREKNCFALMTCLVHSSQKTSVSRVAELLSIIKREVGDNRNFVKKAVN